MRLSTWRPAFLEWLTGKLPINDWTLNAPDRAGKVAGLLPPLQSISYRSVDEGQTIGTATQSLFAVYVYAPSVTFIDLPIAALEGVYQSLSLQASQQWQAITDELFSFQQIAVEEPIVIRKRTDERQAWNIELCWQWKLTFSAEAEAPLANTPVAEINSAIWRASIETFEDAVLDYSGRFPDVTTEP